MEQTFEQIEALWREQDERLQRVEHVQQESLRRLLQRSITSTYRRFLIENIIAVVFGILVEAFLLSKAELCFSSWGLAIPYLIFNIVYFSCVIWYAVWVVRFWRHDPLNSPTVEAMRFADRWHLAFKRSAIWGFSVILPVCVLAAFPFITYIFTGKAFHYVHLQYLTPWQILLAVLFYAACIAYSVYELRLTRELKENLKVYDDLLTDQ